MKELKYEISFKVITSTFKNYIEHLTRILINKLNKFYLYLQI